MKVRTGFVSNSSSSSFTCDACGGVESGWDACLSDVYMFNCANGHTVCDSHHDGSIDDRYSVPSEQCPICQLKILSNDDLIKFMLYTTGKSRDDVLGEIRARFPSYDAFSSGMKTKIVG